VGSATGHQQRLPAPPGYPKLAPAPSWAGTELPELTGNGKPLPFHRQADTPVAALPVPPVRAQNAPIWAACNVVGLDPTAALN
jgi:hypothetical protein